MICGQIMTKVKKGGTMNFLSLLNRFLGLIELFLARLQGKGWGSGTVKKEFAAAASLLKAKSPNLVVDVGANRGGYTECVLQKFPNCEVVAFEPSKTNLQTLRQKFADASKVVIEPKALSDKPGTQILYANSEGSSLASLTKRRLDHFNIDFSFEEEIATIRFEDYWRKDLASQKIDIVKIDIEGHELEALSGMGEALDFTEVIQFEFGGCNIDTRTFFQDFWYFFTPRGFRLYRITPFGPVLIDRYSEIDETFTTTNFLARNTKISSH